MKRFVIDFESLPWQEPAPGVRFKAFVKGGKRLRLVEFAGEFAEPDWCLKGHIGYVLEGEMEIVRRGQGFTFYRISTCKDSQLRQPLQGDSHSVRTSLIRGQNCR